MNSFKNIIASGSILALALLSGAADAAGTTASASATIFTPVAVTKTADLGFGKIAPGASSSVVTVGAAGTFACGTGLTCYGTHAPAAFSIAGYINETVTVTVDPSVTLSDGASHSMVASLSPSANAVLLTGGLGSFTVGGALTLLANQSAGNYNGSFAVSVDYP